MVVKIPFYQNETKEPLEFEYIDEDGAPIDISGDNAPIIEFKIFTRDFATVLVTANLLNGKIVKTGTNTAEYRPEATDLSTVGLYNSELYTKFSDNREDRNQDCIVEIKQKAPSTP